MIIEFYIKNVYGKENIYNKDENIAKNIQTLTTKKTIDKNDMQALENLGFTFKQVIV